jgi:hypothetical protein
MNDCDELIKALRCCAPLEKNDLCPTICPRFHVCGINGDKALITEAASTIDEITAGLRNAQRWISVKEQLPSEKEEVTSIYDPYTLAEIDVEYHMVSDLVAIYVNGEDGNSFVCDDITVDGKWVNFPHPQWEVTHWVKLPDPPQNVGKSK